MSPILSNGYTSVTDTYGLGVFVLRVLRVTPENDSAGRTEVSLTHRGVQTLHETYAGCLKPGAVAELVGKYLRQQLNEIVDALTLL